MEIPWIFARAFSSPTALAVTSPVSNRSYCISWKIHKVFHSLLVNITRKWILQFCNMWNLGTCFEFRTDKNLNVIFSDTLDSDLSLSLDKCGCMIDTRDVFFKFGLQKGERSVPCWHQRCYEIRSRALFVTQNDRRNQVQTFNRKMEHFVASSFS